MENVADVAQALNQLRQDFEAMTKIRDWQLQEVRALLLAAAIQSPDRVKLLSDFDHLMESIPKDQIGFVRPQLANLCQSVASRHPQDF
jgi:hypothetical protein